MNQNKKFTIDAKNIYGQLEEKESNPNSPSFHKHDSPNKINIYESAKFPDMISF